MQVECSANKSAGGSAGVGPVGNGCAEGWTGGNGCTALVPTAAVGFSALITAHIRACKQCDGSNGDGDWGRCR